MMIALSFFIVSIAVFAFWAWCYKRFAFTYVNPLLLSVFCIAGLLIFFDIPYDHYMQGGQWLSWWIEPSVVALGFPLYKQLERIRRQWLILVALCSLTSVLALTLNVIFARFFDLSIQSIFAIATANITTAIAMATSVEMGGSAALAGIAVMVAGVTGSVFGLLLLQLLRIKNTSAQGLAIGGVSHALGTASIARTSLTAAAYASTALILCALITALLAPYYVPWLLGMF